MKTIRGISKVVWAVQLGLFGMALIELGFLFGAILFTMITGATQVILALFLLGNENYRVKVSFYLASVVIYFLVLYFLFQYIPEPLNYVFSIGVPVLLAGFISSIIHNKTRS
jgi:hypothetical protein